MPGEMMKVYVFARNCDISSNFLNLLKMVTIDFLLIVGNTKSPRVIDTLDVSTSDSKKNTLDNDITHILSLQ